jgi:hypothetical protein
MPRLACAVLDRGGIGLLIAWQRGEQRTERAEPGFGREQIALGIGAGQRREHAISDLMPVARGEACAEMHP